MPGDFTVGVEEEYQLVCSERAELRSRARDVLDTDWSGDIRPETQQTMLEIGTRICSDTRELDRELRRLRFQVASAAAADDLSCIAAGTHPFSLWQGHRWTEGERYEWLIERFGRVMRSDHIFGMHVHIAVPEGTDRASILNVARSYSPHLLALSASSPVFEGEDTGYASYRTILGRRMPMTGPPPRFPSDSSYRRFVDILVEAGAIRDASTFYWSIRPHPVYPTLEFRIADVCPRVEDAVAIAALTRVIVAGAVEGRLKIQDAELSESATDALLANNEWQAARYGLDASLVDPERQYRRVPLRESITRLTESLHPVAERLGDVEALDGIATILRRGNGADRIRERLETNGSLSDLVQWLARESLVGTGVDRRQRQREAG